MSNVNSIIVVLLRLRSELARVVDKFLDLVGSQRKFHSSKKQDRWAIEEIFNRKSEGYFVEVGAGDGRTHSNTFVLERDFGWSGIIIEANPYYSEAIYRHRSCLCEFVCVDSQNAECEFFCFGHLSGIVAKDTDNTRENRGALLAIRHANILNVTCKPLHEILDSLKAPSSIDFLSIDVEGAEYRVLKNFPFDRYSFNAIVIERPTKEVHSLLLEAGYVLEKIQQHDGFYLSRDFANQLGISGIEFSGSAKKNF